MELPLKMPQPKSTNLTTNSLRKDHDIIKNVLRATATCIQLLKEGKHIPPGVLLDTVDFISNFIERCHHAKEEQGLFPALEATGMQRQNSAIGTMLHEHEEARKLAEQIKTAVNLYLTDKNTEHAKSLVIQSCGAYVDRIERHILKDDTRLFVMAERRLNGRENDVSSAIAEVEADKMGTDARIKYEQKADRYLHWFSKMET